PLRASSTGSACCPGWSLRAGGSGCSGDADLCEQTPEGRTCIGSVIGSGLNTDVAGSVVLDAVVDRVCRAAAPCPLPAQSGRPSCSGRSCGSSRTCCAGGPG